MCLEHSLDKLSENYYGYERFYYDVKLCAFFLQQLVVYEVHDAYCIVT